MKESKTLVFTFKTDATKGEALGCVLKADLKDREKGEEVLVVWICISKAYLRHT